MENWNYYYPRLKERYDELNDEMLAYFAFDPTLCESPLPRTSYYIPSDVYTNSSRLNHLLCGAKQHQLKDLSILSDEKNKRAFLGPQDPIYLLNDSMQIDFGGEIAVITGDVPRGVSDLEAGNYIKLIMLNNGISLHGVFPEQYAMFGKRAMDSFSPVAVTPDELREAWSGHKVCLPLLAYLNGALFGYPDGGEDVQFDFSMLISHIAQSHSIKAGTIITSGDVSNKKPSVAGNSCVAQKRDDEVERFGSAKTPFLSVGDEVHIEMLDKNLNDVFGAIKQKILQYPSDSAVNLLN